MTRSKSLSSLAPDEAVPAAADIDAVFRAKGIPMTRQRRQVWEFFALGSRAATIAEATDGLREAGRRCVRRRRTPSTGRSYPTAATW